MKHLFLQRIYEDTTAGNFNKPNVGDSETMLTNISNRCDIVPWEIVVLFIDEIDGIAPNRKNQNTAGHKIDLLSVFLAIMDGNIKK